MATEGKTDVRYQPTFCTLLRKHVWAIMTKQADGSWRTVNCLDKDDGCFSLECAFTSEQGAWPYTMSPLAEPHAG